jgi:hypothetical protein
MLTVICRLLQVRAAVRDPTATEKNAFLVALAKVLIDFSSF